MHACVRLRTLCSRSFLCAVRAHTHTTAARVLLRFRMTRKRRGASCGAASVRGSPPRSSTRACMRVCLAPAHASACTPLLTQHALSACSRSCAHSTLFGTQAAAAANAAEAPQCPFCRHAHTVQVPSTACTAAFETTVLKRVQNAATNELSNLTQMRYVRSFSMPLADACTLASIGASNRVHAGLSIIRILASSLTLANVCAAPRHTSTSAHRGCCRLCMWRCACARGATSRPRGQRSRSTGRLATGGCTCSIDARMCNAVAPHGCGGGAHPRRKE
jgi:hypothetical protein